MFTPAESIEEASSYTAGASRHALGDEVSDDDDLPSSSTGAQRDAGVSDAVWHQLLLDKAKEEEAEREHQRLQEEERKLKEWLKACADAKRQQELEELERQRKALEELERQRKALEEQRLREAKAKIQLKKSGRCPVGFEWIKQSGGYRCAGGSHWISNDQISKMFE